MIRTTVFGAVLALGLLVTGAAGAECLREVDPSGSGDSADYCLDELEALPFDGYHESCEQEARRMAVELDDVDEGDVASYIDGCETARAEWLASHEEDRTSAYIDELALRAARADVASAPAFCAVVTVRRDATRGWVAVCELEGGAL